MKPRWTGRRTLLLFLFIAVLMCALVIEQGRKAAELKMGRAATKYKIALVKFFGFPEENSLKEWEEKIFKGRVVYRVEKKPPLSYVKATAKAAASALYYKIKIDAKGKRPVISWKWRIAKFPEKVKRETLETCEEDDFAARVYVIFPAVFFTNSKVLEYVWAKTLEAGTVGTSPYSKNIKVFVARSGSARDGEWAHEERDIIADYIRAFGRTPEHDIGAVAFMTNAEHTLTAAEAMYDDIILGYREDPARKGGGYEDKVPKDQISHR